MLIFFFQSLFFLNGMYFELNCIIFIKKVKAMKTKKIITVLILFILIVSCKKDPDTITPGIVTKTTDLKVPQSFSWQSSRDISLNVSTQGNQLFDVISVFTSNPYSGSKPIIKGSAKTGMPFTSVLHIPSSVTEIYILKTSADGSSEIKKLSALQTTLNVVFANKKSSTPKSIPYEINNGPGTSADYTINQTSGTIDIDNNKTYIINSNLSFYGKIQWQTNSNSQYSTIKINSNVTFNLTKNIDMGTNCSIEVLPGAKLTINYKDVNVYNSGAIYIYTGGELHINKLDLQSTATKLVNYGTTTVYSWAGTVSGSLENYAYLHIMQATSTSSNASFTNKGDMIFESDLDISKNILNTNFLQIKGNLKANTIDIDNRCKLLVDNNFTLNSSHVISFPYGGTSIIVGNKIIGNSSSYINLNEGSLLVTDIMEFNSGTYVEGIGTAKSSVKVNTSFNNMWGSVMKSNVEMTGPTSSAPAGMLLQNGAIYNSNADATNYIATSDCSPGVGFIPILDADNDGVVDSQDDYPNDNTKAFNNYLPGANTYGTIMFEDLWPSKGDFDFNDLVINYKINQITDAANKVVEIDASYKIKAVGGAISNGFGIRFDGLNANQIQSVTGTHLSSGNQISVASNGTENGQDKAVIILFDKTSHLIYPQGTSFVNTVQANPTINAYVFNVVIKLSSPTNPSLIGIAPYNYFIFRTNTRGHEIHAINKSPTTLANTALFSTIDDVSNVGTAQYYRTISNLPWAIDVPDEIDYPSEKNDIVTVFTNFADWAQSAGLIKSDWYSDVIGYRNNSLIFHYAEVSKK